MIKSKKNKPTRGTDEAFLQLMKVSGNSVLKLFGFPEKKANKYHFQAVVLKDKELKPDVEGFPILKSDEGRVFLEFQGYSDPFIRHRLIAEVFLACASEQYEGFVMAGIVYTDEKYKTAALSLNTFMNRENCQLSDCFQEIVLTDYTEEQLLNIDPKLVVLAPFTLPKKTDKTMVLAKGKQWGQSVTQTFAVNQQGEALNILGLFILNRFRKFRYEEVRAMLNFDLMDTVAGQQLYEMGELNNARKVVVEVLEERFGIVPSKMIDEIRAIPRYELLNSLFKQAIRCSDMSSFKEMLSKAKE